MNDIFSNAINETINAINTSAKRSNLKPEDKRKFVYLLQCGENYKIGVTRNLNQRLKQLRNSIPIELNLILYIETPFAFKFEKRLHEIFKDKRLTGEWFKLNQKETWLLFWRLLLHEC